MRLLRSVLGLAAVVAIGTNLMGEPLSTEQEYTVPEVVKLDSLKRIYEGVRFDHSLHDSYASCVECHHHLAGQASADPTCSSCHRSGAAGISVNCKSCHQADRFSGDSLLAARNQSRYHIDVIGLMGAYHLNCLGCHLSLTAGPTGCLDCHRRRGTEYSLEGTEGKTFKEAE